MAIQPCLEKILRGDSVNTPVVRVLNVKRINRSQEEEEYGFVFSDDRTESNPFVFVAAKELNRRLRNNQLTSSSIIRLDCYSRSEIRNVTGATKKRLITIIDFTVLMKSEKKMSTPTKVESRQRPAKMLVSSASCSQFAATNVNAPIFSLPIKSIHPQNISRHLCTVKGRIVNKPDIRFWKNSRGEGKFFHIDFQDETACIRITAFNECVDKFYERLEFNRVYFLKLENCSIKLANQEYASLPHPYELHLKINTVIYPAHRNDSSIPQVSYDRFTSLRSLKDLDLKTVVDIIGVCINVSESRDLVATNTGKPLKKREIQIVDETSTRVNLTVWNNAVEKFNSLCPPVVVVIRQGRLNEFNNKKFVEFMSSSTIEVNPTNERSRELLEWYRSLGKNYSFDYLNERKTCLLNDFKNCTIEKGIEFFDVDATVVEIFERDLVYEGCPNQSCRKKVTPETNGSYRCEKCNQTFDHFTSRFRLRIRISDWTDSQWVTVFGLQAEKFLGAPAQEIVQANYEKRNEILRRPLLNNFSFCIRAKIDDYNNLNYLNLTASEVRPLDYKRASKKLLMSLIDIKNESDLVMTPELLDIY